MIVTVFGNPMLESDSLPLRIMPDLQKKFPKIEFRVLDPNEEWDMSEEMIILDSVEGIEQITIFKSLDEFQAAPRVSMHDFDAYTNLRLLTKLGKLKKVTIIGLPREADEKNILINVESKINQLGSPTTK